jgi:hypothetical protein
LSPDPVVWLDASVGVSDGVGFTWEDRSWHHNDAVQTSALHPTSGADASQNGLAYVHFSGRGDFLQLPPGFSDFTRGLTIFAKVRMDLTAHPTTNACLFDFAAFANQVEDAISLCRAEGTQNELLLLVRTGDASSSAVFIPGALDGVWMLLEIVAGAGEPSAAAPLQAYRDGSTLNLSAATWTIPRAVTRTSALIGRSNRVDAIDDRTGLLHADLNTLVIYDRALNDQERREVERRLMPD